MNLFNQLFQPNNTVAVVSDSMVYGISEWLGISSDPQGFFLYLLIMVGVVVIVIILIYNWVEERRFNKHVDSNFSTIEQDALLDDGQQEFLDKFASTTGVLNDGPNGAAISDIPEDIPFEDDRSIEEVYSDLVNTMSKRNRAKVEPAGVTIDHQAVEVMPEPDLGAPNMPEDILADLEPVSEEVLIIPDAIEAELVVEPVLEEAVTTVPFTEQSAEEAILSFDANETKKEAPLESFFEPAPLNEPVMSEEAAEVDLPEPEGLTEEAQEDVMDDQGIKDIINRAFKEKYNPNYKAEMEALDAQAAALDASQEDVPIVDAEVEQSGANTEAEPEISLETELPDQHEELPSQPVDDLLHTTPEASTGQQAEPRESLSASAEEAVPEQPNNTYQQLLDEGVDAGMEASADAQVGPETESAAQPTATAKPPEPVQNPEPATVASAFSTELPDLMNAHVDIVGTIETSKPVSAALLLESFSTLHKQFELPVFALMQSEQSKWLLLNDAREADIERFLIDGKPLHISASMQMADRNGPASRNALGRFEHALTEIATSMSVGVEWVDPSDPADRASSLDAFCIEVDKTMFFHLANTSSPFTGIKLRGLVEAQNMALEGDGSFKYYSENAEGQKNTSPDFVLFNRENHLFNEEMLRSSVIKAVTMQLDIPLVASDAQALDRMVEIARDLESNLNSQLVDDKNRAITEVHLSRIREQIKAIHSAMQLRGITPGSVHAQRLFS